MKNESVVKEKQNLERKLKTEITVAKVCKVTATLPTGISSHDTN